MSKKDNRYESHWNSYEDEDEWGYNDSDRKRYDRTKSGIREQRRNKYQKRDEYLDDRDFSMK